MAGDILHSVTITLILFSNSSFPPFSIGGFLAARVLADYFTKVVIVETDLRLVSNSARVGQRNQAHFFQPISLQIMRTFFADFDQHAKNAGIPIQPAWYRVRIGSTMLRHRLEKVSEMMATSRITCVLYY